MGENFAEKDFAQLDELLAELGSKKGTLIPILQRAQDMFGYLPREVLIRIGEKVGIPIS